jgi:hypothetical protein
MVLRRPIETAAFIRQIIFRVPSDPSRIDLKCGVHLLQADLSDL